eukprot:m.353698 g.353698  ORF g.353698 m.353698 type:complete len:382 (+) comp16823_c0_seq1:530-1675(+)
MTRLNIREGTTLRDSVGDRVFKILDDQALGHDKDMYIALAYSEAHKLPASGKPLDAALALAKSRSCVVRILCGDKRALYLRTEAALQRQARMRPIPNFHPCDSAFQTNVQPPASEQHGSQQEREQVTVLVHNIDVEQDLATYFADNGWDSKDVFDHECRAKLFRMICDIPLACHRRGFVIRTLKLASVFFTKTGGLVCLSLPQVKEVTTPSHKNSHKNQLLSPSARLGQANDVVILGYILGYLFTGKRPFISSNPQHRAKVSFPTALRLPLAFQRLLSSTLSLKPSDRPTVQELQSHHFLNPIPSASPPVRVVVAAVPAQAKRPVAKCVEQSIPRTKRAHAMPALPRPSVAAAFKPNARVDSSASATSVSASAVVSAPMQC